MSLSGRFPNAMPSSLRVEVALVLTVVLSSAAAVSAEPSLRVRAQVSIELHTAPTPTGLRLLGTLRDDLGAPLANRDLTAYFDAQTQRGQMRGRVARTDDTGRFGMPIACGTATACRATVEFDGDAYHERTATSQLVETQRAELQLAFLQPRDLNVSLDAPYTQVVVQALSSVGGAHVHLALENELGRVLGTGTTDADASLQMQIDSDLLGEPGLGELVLRAAGDATRTAARASKPLVRTRGTGTALRAQYDAVRQELRVTAQLHTRVGPVAQRAVGLFVDDRHLATLITDARGMAERTLGARDTRLEQGSHTLVARFESDLPGLGSSRSQPVALHVEPPPRPNSAWLIAPALASIAFTIWSARRVQRVGASKLSAPRQSADVQLGTSARGRTPPSHTITGKVSEADSGRAVPATLLLTGPADAQTMVSVREDGEFSSGSLATGHYRVRVLSPGYEPAAFELTIPHHGRGSDLRVALRSLRALALNAYAEVADRAVTQGEPCTATVRETLAAAISGGLTGPSFEPLAQSVEQIAYARAVPFEDDLRAVQRTAATALQEISERQVPPADPELG